MLFKIETVDLLRMDLLRMDLLRMDLLRIAVLLQTGLAQIGLAQKGLAQNGFAQGSVTLADIRRWSDRTSAPARMSGRPPAEQCYFPLIMMVRRRMSAVPPADIRLDVQQCK
jgi:hypothetical protein